MTCNSLAKLFPNLRSRPRMTKIVRGTAFLHVLFRRPIVWPDSRRRSSWSSHRRLKRGSPFGHIVSGHLVASFQEYHSLSHIIDPSEGLDGVYFHVNLFIHISKQKELPCYLKQLAFERINSVPKDAAHMYTNGSKHGSDCSGSGIYINFRYQEVKIQGKKSGLLLGILFQACCNS
ncbi:RNase H domain-containing protein [Trichonephila clavipes]|uniref:RNase H domain-containing protein n=1 Tax=Trichonephila clavipes TaxID=2585209 RepID=A0A8X6VJZ8_TRICX|nr:RNase H domain-containing protein [Trichonephila clavipes]